MLSHCLKCKKNTGRCKKPKVARTKNGRIILLSKCKEYDSKKSKFIKEQEGSELLSILRIKAPLSKFFLVVPLMF